MFVLIKHFLLLQSQTGEEIDEDALLAADEDEDEDEESRSWRR